MTPNRKDIPRSTLNAMREASAQASRFADIQAMSQGQRNLLRAETLDRLNVLHYKYTAWTDAERKEVSSLLDTSYLLGVADKLAYGDWCRHKHYRDLMLLIGLCDLILAGLIVFAFTVGTL